MLYQGKIDGTGFHQPFEARDENEALRKASDNFDGMLCGTSCNAVYLTPHGETITVEVVACRVTILGQTAYEAHIARRERQLRRSIEAIIRDALETAMRADVEGDDRLGVKGMGTVMNGGRKMRLSFRDGIGIDVTVATAYKPEVT